MGKGPRYNVAFQRRIQFKTDYAARRQMIISKIPRIVARGSKQHMSVQLIEALPVGDKTLVSAHSTNLIKDFGWKGPCGNIPIAYLTGFLLGNKAASIGIKQAILDIGLNKPSIGCRIFAVLKGALDSGIDVPHDEKILPEESRIRGEHIISYSKRLIETDQILYEKQFSEYLSRDLKLERFTEYFDQTKKKIEDFFRKGEE